MRAPKPGEGRTGLTAEAVYPVRRLIKWLELSRATQPRSSLAR